MTKIITRCFQGGGAFYNACRRLAKSALTALALIAATFTANAAEVISINFGADTGDRTVDSDTTVVPDVSGENVTGDAWNNVSSGNNGTDVTLTRYWDGTQGAALANTVKVTWTSNNTWRWNDADNAPYQKGYLDDGQGVGVHIAVTGISYDVYDLIIYVQSDSAPQGFVPFTVNGISYTYADGETVEGTASWGERVAGPQLGKNALKITGLCGSGVIIQGKGADGSPRGCIAAIQIVQSSGPATKLPGADFSYGPNPATAPTGWFTEWKPGVGADRMIGPVDALMLNGSTPKSDKFDMPSTEDVTIAAIVNLDNVTRAENDEDLSVIYCLGEVSRATTRGLVLSKRRNDDGGYDLYLNNVKKTSGGSIWASPDLCLKDDGSAQYDTKEKGDGHYGRPYCIFKNITPGYHLIVATQSKEDNRLTLSVDGVMEVGPAPVATGVELLGDGNHKGGFRLGACFGGSYTDTNNGFGRFRNSTGLVVDRIMAWDSVLTEDQIALLWNQYSAVIENQGELSYNSSFATANAAIYVPSVSSTEHTLSVTGGGTMNIPATAVVDVPSISATGNYNSTITVDGGSLTSVVVRTDNNKNRVNIPDNQDSYLVEVDRKYRDDESVVINEREMAFRIHAPKDPTEETMDRLRLHLDSLEGYLEGRRLLAFNAK